MGPAFALLLAISAQEQPRAATSRPVEMTASGGLSIDLKKQIGVAKGDVLIKRDDVLVCCDEAEAKYAKNEIERVTCRGRVVIVRPDGTRATASVAIFAANEDTVTLTGEARVLTETADLAGEKIIYDIAHDKLVVEGQKSRFRFQPAAAQPPPARACGEKK